MNKKKLIKKYFYFEYIIIVKTRLNKLNLVRLKKKRNLKTNNYKKNINVKSFS